LLKEKAELESQPLEEVSIDVNIRLHCAMPRDPTMFTEEQLSEMSAEELKTFYTAYDVEVPEEEELLPGF